MLQFALTIDMIHDLPCVVGLGQIPDYKCIRRTIIKHVILGDSCMSVRTYMLSHEVVTTTLSLPA